MNDNTQHNLELEDESLEMIDETADSAHDDELKKAVEEQMRNLRRQNLLIGAQSACNVVLQKIYAHQRKPGKKTYRDCERLIKEIQQFCETGISRKVNPDGTTSPMENTEEDTKQS